MEKNQTANQKPAPEVLNEKELAGVTGGDGDLGPGSCSTPNFDIGNGGSVEINGKDYICDNGNLKEDKGPGEASPRQPSDVQRSARSGRGRAVPRGPRLQAGGRDSALAATA